MQTLTKKMRECIELEVCEPNLTLKEIGDRLGKHYNTILNWKHSDIYKEELERRLKEVWKDSVKRAQKNVINIANEKVTPSTITAVLSANKYILDSCGYGAEQNVNVAGGLVYSIDYGDDDESPAQ